MSPSLWRIHDDNGHEITVVVHGLAISTRDYELLAKQVHLAELRGSVYVLCWDACAVSISALASGDLRKTAAARTAGEWLARTLGRLRDANRRPITLIGHSQGALVIAFALDWIEERSRQIERAILMGGVVDADEGYWERVARAVRKEVVNVYSQNDGWLVPLPESIGRGPIGSRFHRKIRDIEAELGHCDYWKSLPDILGLAWPTRRRSRSYHGEVDCKCPWCNSNLLVAGNTDVICPDCRIDFEYRLSDGEYYWDIVPKAVLCSFCEGENHAVQESSRYQCRECRRWSNFQRQGNRVWILNSPD